MRKLIGLLVGISIVIILAVGGYGYYLYEETLKPVNVQDESVINYTIEPGTTTKKINQQLADLGLIKYPKVANLVVRLNNWSHIQAGEYALSPSQTLEEMYQMFESGVVVEPNMVKVTIPEGYDLEYIAAVMSPLVGLMAEDLLKEWNNREYLKTLIDEYWFLTEDILQDGIKYPLEGYIYPITYSFLDEPYTVDELTHELLDMTEYKLNQVRDLFDQSPLSIHQVMALASVVEGETQRVEEMATVAGVFFNRINSGMYLQSDMTVLYALGEHAVRVTEAMTQVNSPYNTYVTQGIPIGPVSSPSLDAVQAVLKPEEHHYIYFIADMFSCVDGTTHFFETYEEHMAFYYDYLLPSYEAGTSVCK
ncbi:MAG: endolytic transglycosylase MltG [Turicibacter sp.]|nr:endolytic transglycosylase MltG [Turicibacter sp.]